jgi:hypothetical protein
MSKGNKLKINLMPIEEKIRVINVLLSFLSPEWEIK